jgi:hypothetical protein
VIIVLYSCHRQDFCSGLHISKVISFSIWTSSPLISG